MRRILKCAVLACSWSGTSCLEPICTVSVQLWTASPDRNALLSVRSCMMLRVNGDDLPAATSDQQHPLQSLCEDLQELHVVLIPALVFGWSWHVQQHQLGSLGFVNYNLIQFHCSVHSSHISLIPVKNSVIHT